MTQQELAKGICTQALISKIERNETNPSSTILYKIAARLEVPIAYFDVQQMNQNMQEEINEVKNRILMHLSRREYTETEHLLINYSKPLNDVDKVFLNWVKGILQYYLENNVKKSLSILNLLNASDIGDYKLSIEVLKSIATIYYEEEDYETAEKVFKDVYSKLNESIPFEVRLKIIFNYSLCLKKNNKIDESLQLLMIGIDICKQYNSMFALGDLLYQKSLILSEINEPVKALVVAEASSSIFAIQNNNLYNRIAKEQVKTLKNKFLLEYTEGL